MANVSETDVPMSVVEGHSQTKVIREHGPSAVERHNRERTKAADPQHAPIDRTISEEQIAERAYELYLNRGAEHGADLDDWLQAERELGRSTAGGPTDE